MREIVEQIVLNIDQSFSMHDFRMVKGPNKTNVIFDVAIPFDTQLNETDIIKTIKSEISKIDEKYIPVIMVEKQMFI